MTENMLRFSELISGESKEYIDRLCKADQAEIIAMAAEKDVVLTADDFAQGASNDDEGDVSLDEADAIAGGGECYCPFVGGGTEDLNTSGDGTTSGDGGCACVLYGQGDAIYEDSHAFARCQCATAGYGDTF